MSETSPDVFSLVTNLKEILLSFFGVYPSNIADVNSFITIKIRFFLLDKFRDSRIKKCMF